MRNIIGFLIMVGSLFACDPGKQSADQHIQQAIKYHGGEAYNDLSIAFKFRDKFYRMKHDDGKFKYERIFNDSLGREINDILDNNGFKRLVNNKKVELLDKDSAAFANSVNSVHYFALLPYNLKDDAVLAKNKEDVLINGQPYKTIEVKFEQEGGGKDYEDEFMFWFNSKTYDLDYLAYSYQTEGGGVRFRESIRKEEVGGIIFRDYNNYKAEKGTELGELPSMFEKEQLDLLSKIELEFDVEIL